MAAERRNERNIVIVISGFPPRSTDNFKTLFCQGVSDKDEFPGPLSSHFRNTEGLFLALLVKAAVVARLALFPGTTKALCDLG